MQNVWYTRIHKLQRYSQWEGVKNYEHTGKPEISKIPLALKRNN